MRILVLTLVLFAGFAQAQTMQEQILALKKKVFEDPMTAARLEEIANAMMIEEPVWLTVHGQKEKIPYLALQNVPYFYFMGSHLHSNDLKDSQREMHTSIVHRQARAAPELNTLRAYWSFNSRGEYPTVVRADSLDQVIHALLKPGTSLPSNTETLLQAEFQRLTKIMKEKHQNLDEVRVSLNYEKPPEVLLEATSEIGRPLVRATAFLRVPKVRLALGQMADAVAATLDHLGEHSLQLTSYSMKRYAAIEALGDIPDMLTGEGCFAPLAGRRPN